MTGFKARADQIRRAVTLRPARSARGSCCELTSISPLLFPHGVPAGLAVSGRDEAESTFAPGFSFLMRASLRSGGCQVAR